MSTRNGCLIALFFAMLLTIGVIAFNEWQVSQRPTIAVTAHQARSVMRDCVKTRGGTPTVKTVFAGDPLVPEYYEIKCER